MDAVTHPDPVTASFVEEHFVPLRLDTTALDKEARELLRATKPQWAPMFLLLDPRGTELRHWFGWLEPAAFIAQLELALAAQRLLHRDFNGAEALFLSVAATAADREAAAEALFWAGASAYRRDRSMDALESRWSELMRRFPETSWARKSDVFDLRAGNVALPNEAL